MFVGGYSTHFLNTFSIPTQKAFNFSSFKVNPQKVHFLFDN